MKLLSLKLEGEGLEKTSNNLTGSLRTLGLVGVASLGALGGSGIVGGVVALGAAVASASGAVLLLPAAAVAVAAPLATFKLGLIGVEEAFKQLGKGDMTKFNAALDTMAPSAPNLRAPSSTLRSAGRSVSAAC